MNENFYTLLESHFPPDRSEICIETLHDVAYTWDDIDRGTAQIANLLESFGLPPGARIAVQVEKSPEALLLYLATLRAGHIFLPLNTAYREAEAGYFFENAGPSVIVCDPAQVEWVSRVSAATCKSDGKSVESVRCIGSGRAPRSSSDASISWLRFTADTSIFNRPASIRESSSRSSITLERR